MYVGICHAFIYQRVHEENFMDSTLKRIWSSWSFNKICHMNIVDLDMVINDEESGCRFED